MDRNGLSSNSVLLSDGHSSMEFLSFDSICYLVRASDVDFGQPLESYHFVDLHHNLVKACVYPLCHGLQANWQLSGVLSCVLHEQA